jgi:prephenate dehydrogenase
MRAAKVAIIGNLGKYGSVLDQYCRSLISRGLVQDVFGSDRGTDLTNQEAATKADVVIVAVWPRVTVQVIQEMTPVLRSNQLIMDVTSRKVLPVRAMLESTAEVRGLHPMCPPPAGGSWRGQTIVDCPVRLSEWREWSDEWLRLTGARIKTCTPEDHDKYSDVVQRLTHAMALVQAAVVRETGMSITECLEFASPVYRVALSLMGRILAQNPELYYDIQTVDLGVIDVLGVAKEQLTHFEAVVDACDERRFLSDFIASREHFGPAVVRENFELFELLNQLMADHFSADRVVLEIPVERDQPGVLHLMTGVFLAKGINLVSLRSFRAGSAVRFEVVFDRPPQSPEVQGALSLIASEGLATVL